MPGLCHKLHKLHPVYHIPEMCLFAHGLYPQEPHSVFDCDILKVSSPVICFSRHQQGQALRKCSLDRIKLNIRLSGNDVGDMKRGGAEIRDTISSPNHDSRSDQNDSRKMQLESFHFTRWGKFYMISPILKLQSRFAKFSAQQMFSAQGWLDNSKPKGRKNVETSPSNWLGYSVADLFSGYPQSALQKNAPPWTEVQVERGKVKMPYSVIVCSNYFSTQLGATQTALISSSLKYQSHLLLGRLHPSSLHPSHFAFTDGLIQKQDENTVFGQ